MADLQLNIRGDSSDAVDAFRDTGAAAEEAAKKSGAAFKKASDEASEAVKDFGDDAAQAWKRHEEAQKASAEQLAKVKLAFVAVGAAAVKFGVEAVKAYADAERVSKQLERAAGGLSEAFEAQADALEAQLALDGDLVKQQQTLLLQWGAAPKDIEGVVRALADYSVATGEDALGATKKIIKAVETSGSAFESLGVVYQETGDKSEDLRRLSEALRMKFAGAAEADRNSLAGSLRLVESGVDDVKEAFGEMLARLNAGTGILDKVAGSLRGIARGITGGSGFADFMASLSPTGLAANALLGMYGGGPSSSVSGGEVQQPATVRLVDPKGRTREQIAADKAAAAAAKDRADAVRSARDEEARTREAAAKRIHDIEKGIRQAEKEANADADKAAKRRLDALERQNKAEEDATKKAQVEADKRLKQAEEHAEKEMKARQEAADRMHELEKHKADQARQSADAIGAAFVGALTEQLARLAQGEELDPAMFVGEILAATVSAAAAIIGSVYGMPALGAAVGNLAAMGIRAGASGISAAGKKGGRRSYHTGGWVGDEAELPRYHSGAWIRPDEQMAVLQQGERVLSRAEVTAMGGPRGVDGAAGGARPGFVVNVSALDAKSAAESFVSGVDRGLRDALRTGQGFLPQLLPQGVR